MLGLFGQKNKKNAKEIKEKYINDLINCKDVEGGLLYTKDGFIQGYIRVMPVNISLLSQAEKRRKRDLLKEKINGEEHFEFLKLSKSVDLSQQINYLQNLARECDSQIKKMGLLESIRATSRYSQQGEMVENQYYYMFRVEHKDNHSEKDIRDKLFDFVNKLQECEIKAYVLDDMEVIQIANLFFNPTAYSDELDLNIYVSSFINE
jgi:hypothetical protein